MKDSTKEPSSKTVATKKEDEGKDSTQVEGPNDNESANKVGERVPEEGLSDSTSLDMEGSINSDCNIVLKEAHSDKTLADMQAHAPCDADEGNDLVVNISNIAKEGDLSPRQVTNLKKENKKAHESPSL